MATKDPDKMTDEEKLDPTVEPFDGGAKGNADAWHSPQTEDDLTEKAVDEANSDNG